jgi:hypothetical protein
MCSTAASALCTVVVRRKRVSLCWRMVIIHSIVVYQRVHTAACNSVQSQWVEFRALHSNKTHLLCSASRAGAKGGSMRLRAWATTITAHKGALREKSVTKKPFGPSATIVSSLAAAPSLWLDHSPCNHNNNNNEVEQAQTRLVVASLQQSAFCTAALLAKPLACNIYPASNACCLISLYLESLVSCTA